MEPLIRFSDRFSTWAAWAGGGILFATAVMIAIEVVLRKVFAVSMGGADELSNYALAVSSSWTFGYALLRKAHIRIDVLYVRVPQRVRRSLDVLCLALFGFCSLVVSYFAFGVLWTSIQRSSIANTPLATPLWIPQGLWFAGLLTLTLMVFILLAGTLHRLRTRDGSGAQGLSGASTVKEEIEEETGPAKSRTAGGGGP
jgi:TRAP-type C4-dicarboxylate transport system permease small subunit